MCGIFGLASNVRLPPSADAWAHGAIKLLEHRGPDHAGLWSNQTHNILFGHRRLAIIDASDASNQPFTTSAGICLTFNGEIYNFLNLRQELESIGYSFKTTGDAEVIAHAFTEWDTEAFSRLSGAFAIALFDKRTDRCILARDRAGEKPLYYRIFGESNLAFSSELHVLLSYDSSNAKISTQSLDSYLRSGSIPTEHSLVRGISQLPPAHFAVWTIPKGHWAERRYWSPISHPRIPKTLNEDGLIEEAEHLLDNAVSEQLVADRTPGILLSGGLDSSLITAFASRHRSKLDTFTVVLPGEGLFDEARHAQQIANYFQTNHHEVDATQITASDVLAVGQRLDQPLGDSSILAANTLARAVARSAKSVLGGDGGDELFGGYFHYTRWARLSPYLLRFPHAPRHFIGAGLQALWPPYARGRNWIAPLQHKIGHPIPSVNLLFSGRQRVSLIPELADAQTSSSRESEWKVSENSLSLVEQACLLDFQQYLPDDLLVKVDRASMHHSLEVRLPMLNHQLIEFAFNTLPSGLRATQSERKVLLQKVAARVLPPTFDLARKQGFSVPLGRWLRDEPTWRDLARDMLLGCRVPFLERRPVQQLLKQHDQGRRNEERIFALMMLTIWCEETGISQLG